jgi:polygalacturonase
MALTKVSYSMITGAPFNVLDFGANTIPGTTDMTTALQAAITAAVAAGGRVYIPAGTYLITDTITCPAKTMITGEHCSTSASDNGTKILFQPTSLKSLFSTGVTVYPSFKDGYAFENLYILGNSTTSTGNSYRAFDLINVLKSTFRNMRIDGFRVGFRVEATGNNRFEFIQLANHYLYCIQYTGAYASADLWENCRIGNSPIGVQTDGYNHAIVFNNCIFETIETYGVNLVKECYGWIFSKTYVEDVPSVNVATNCMFRVGYDGALLAGAPQLQISGGNLFGSNSATQIGALLDVDFTDGVTLGGFSCGRFVNIVKTSANTQTNQIVVSGWTAVSISGAMITDGTKISGYYPFSVASSGTRNRQDASFGIMSANTLTFDSGASATTSTNLQLGRNTDTAVGGAGGASVLPATPLGYLIAFIGATQIKIPYYNA